MNVTNKTRRVLGAGTAGLLVALSGLTGTAEAKPALEPVNTTAADHRADQGYPYPTRPCFMGRLTWKGALLGPPPRCRSLDQPGRSEEQSPGSAS